MYIYISSIIHNDPWFLRCPDTTRIHEVRLKVHLRDPAPRFGSNVLIHKAVLLCSPLVVGY